MKFALGKPRVPEAHHLTILSHLQGIARRPVDPCVANLLRHNGQLAAVGLNGLCNIRQVAGRNLGPRKSRGIVGMYRLDLAGGVRAAVVPAHARCHHQIGPRHPDAATVLAMISNGQAGAGGVLPEENLRHVREGRRGIEPYVQKVHALCGQGRNKSPRVPRHIGHFGP